MPQAAPDRRPDHHWQAPSQLEEAGIERAEDQLPNKFPIAPGSLAHTLLNGASGGG
jgi:hypothetical protein